jgi:predicted nuclease with TOPRIM domain
MDPIAAEKIVDVIGSVYDELRNSVTKVEFNELKEVVKELAEAQKRTEIRLEKLTERVDELTANVSRLERKVEDLVGEMKGMKLTIQDMKQEIGGLSHTVGYRLEDEAMKSLPALLKRDFSIETQGSLTRDYLEIAPKKYVELNIWGQGLQCGQQVEIIGEAKSQLKKKDVDQFIQTLRILEPIINKPIIPLLVTYQTSVDVRRYIQGKNIALYFSHQL